MIVRSRRGTEWRRYDTTSVMFRSKHSIYILCMPIAISSFFSFRWQRFILIEYKWWFAIPHLFTAFFAFSLSFAFNIHKLHAHSTSNLSIFGINNSFSGCEACTEFFSCTSGIRSFEMQIYRNDNLKIYFTCFITMHCMCTVQCDRSTYTVIKSGGRIRRRHRRHNTAIHYSKCVFSDFQFNWNFDHQ